MAVRTPNVWWRWVLVIVISLAIVGLIAYARGQAQRGHHTKPRAEEATVSAVVYLERADV